MSFLGRQKATRHKIFVPFHRQAICRQNFRRPNPKVIEPLSAAQVSCDQGEYHYGLSDASERGGQRHEQITSTPTRDIP